MSSGKFHGMICPQTPSGHRLCVLEGVVELIRPTGVVEEVRRHLRQIEVARLLDRLAAIHRLEHGKLARLFLQNARDAKRYFPRSRPGRRLQLLKARRAAPTARPTSAASACAISASCFSFAGFSDGKYWPLARGDEFAVNEKLIPRGDLHRTLSGAGA
jgi:hypothetical protein